MKRVLTKLVILLIAAGAVAGLVVAYHTMSQQRKAEAAQDKPVAAKSRTSFSPNGETVVTLDSEAQKRIALQVEPIKVARYQPELKGYGRVLDAAPLAALYAELVSGQVAWDASRKEFERVRQLNQTKDASDKTLQAAEAAARHDQILVESVRTRLVSGWGNAIASRTDLEALAQSLATMESALVRIDLPAGETLAAPPAAARIAAATAEERYVPIDWLGPAPSVDAQLQGQAFLALVKTNTLRLAAGATLVARLELAGEAANGFVIPDSAVLRHAGGAWVYLQTGEEKFSRREIALNRPSGAGWFVTAGLPADGRLVVHGAQALLSEEQKYQIKMLE